MKAAALAAAALYSGSALAATSYSLVKDYAGQNFFDGWVFYDYYDNTTNGAHGLSHRSRRLLIHTAQVILFM